MDSIGSRIKIERVKLGLTQEQLANKINVSSSVISQWEKGTSNPTYRSAMKLAKGLEVSYEYLANGEKIENNLFDDEITNWIQLGIELKSKGYDLSEIEIMVNNIIFTIGRKI